MSLAASSLSMKKEPTLSSDNTKLLPILIIPGLMSSGLEVEESYIKKGWEGERIWLNVASIGISALYFGNATKSTKYSSQDLHDDDEEETRQSNVKSAWLKHMLLDSDHESDPPGTKVRPISGLEAVDYLTPGAFTNYVSYVFGPFIKMLKENGYNPEDGKTNLMAAPYDWRLAPCTLEKRDKYFTNTMSSIEKLYNDNESTPVVLFGHSLGCKACHYLLNFALDSRGQNWIDKYVHTYMPIGGPHLGAPKGMRGLICGDKMSLDTFLSDEEALIFSRSMGGIPWLIPSDLPEGVPACNYILPHGVLEISIAHAVDADPLVNKRTSANRPKHYQLVISGKGFDGPQEKDSKRIIRTFFHRTTDDYGANVVVFKDKFSFATETKPYYNETLQFLLQEPGLASAKKEKQEWQINPLVYCLCCLCVPCMLVYKVLEVAFFGLLRSATLTADAIAGSAGGSTTLAFSEGIKIPDSVWNGKPVTIKVPLYHVDDYGQYEGCSMTRKNSRQTNLYVELKWTTFNPTKPFRKLCSPVCRPSLSAVQLPITRNKKQYEEFSGYEIAEREGLEEHLRFIKNKYDSDKCRPRNTSDPPPVNRIHAIYGINLPTEVGCVYSRQDTCLSERMLQSLYVPDKKAIIEKDSRYKISGGVIMEIPTTKQKGWGDIEVSGDGTVPYWSLAHVKTWQSEKCEVTVQELEKSEHRNILVDSRMYEAVLNYVCVNDDEK